jgi:SAM-dependent methyltransferase
VADPTAAPPHDAAFEKYVRRGGAYHWDHVSRDVRRHHAFTAERYRRTLHALGDVAGSRVLDYGCGDGALLAQIAQRVGPDGEAHGYEPNATGRAIAAEMLRRHRLAAGVHAEVRALPDACFDRVVCADVVEHASDPSGVVDDIHRLLKPGGRAVLTTPVRLSERPLDRNHVREWFPGDLAAFLERGPLTLVHHEQAIPVAAVEVYGWRPRLLGGFPVFRLVCNLVSIYLDRNALSWLNLPQQRFLLQLAVLAKP